jgi:hypothetical protein
MFCATFIFQTRSSEKNERWSKKYNCSGGGKMKDTPKV